MRRLIALVSLLVAVDLAMWSAIVPLLPYYRSELGLTKVESGWLLAAFSIAVVATSIPLGHLADRIGARRVVAAGAVAMAVATLGLGFAGSFWALLAARAVQGVGDAAVWGAVKVAFWVLLIALAVAVVAGFLGRGLLARRSSL